MAVGDLPFGHVRDEPIGRDLDRNGPGLCILSVEDPNADAELTRVFGHHPIFATGNSTDTYLFYVTSSQGGSATATVTTVPRNGSHGGEPISSKFSLTALFAPSYNEPNFMEEKWPRRLPRCF